MTVLPGMTVLRGRILVGGLATAAFVGVASAASAAPGISEDRPARTKCAPRSPPGRATRPSPTVSPSEDASPLTRRAARPQGGQHPAPAGSPERYSEYTTPPPGVTITEAQALNVLKQITANLKAQGLTLRDVISMRAYLANAPGSDTADFAGWNRAYRQYFANTDLSTGAPVKVPLGTAPPALAMYVNSARPSRVTLEIENLPVPGWLVEVEIVAAFR